MDVSLKNNKYIIFIHERALSLVYSDHVSSFDELLKKNGSFSIHYRNAQSLHGLSPSIMKNVSHLNANTVFHTTLGHKVNFLAEIQKQ